MLEPGVPWILALTSEASIRSIRLRFSRANDPSRSAAKQAAPADLFTGQLRQAADAYLCERGTRRR